MPLVATEAVVLHVLDYLESSRILRLATREAGVVSVLAKGARRARSRVGSAVDLFAGGVAQLYLKPGRELQTLAGFDVTRSRQALALDLGRFGAAAVLAELALCFVRDDPNPEVHDVLVQGLDAITVAPAGHAAGAGLAAAWRFVGELGFAPAVDSCGSCHASLATEAVVPFSHPVGGALCASCAQLARGARRLPPEARAALRAWLAGAPAPALTPGAIRAHQRLLREFLGEHLVDGRPLRALDAWERAEGAG
jgi:DNA repair protein RecO (recombination protein O)